MEHKTVTTPRKSKRRKDIVIALVAHDAKKADIAMFTNQHRATLSGCGLIATGSTGRMITQNTGLEVKCMRSGPDGGDLQIGGLQHDLGAPVGVDLEVCLPTPNLLPAENEVVPRELSGGLFASLVAVSPPDSISEAFADLAIWACERGYVRAGPVRLVPLAIVGSPEEDKQHVIEVMFPVGVAA